MAVTPYPRHVVKDLARLLGVPEDRVEEGLALAHEGAYETWTIPKGNGRVRRIDSPAPALKSLQRLVLDRLLYRAPVSPFAHGFVPGRSIVTNARLHAETAQAMLSLDLQDAYPSVHRRRVRKTLEWAVGRYVTDALETPTVDARRGVLDALADLCTHADALPQGAPTSGALLNRACLRLDRMAAVLVRQYRSALPDLKYSRYADDLTFTAATEIPKAFVDVVLRAVLRSGFASNHRKLRRRSVRSGDLVICGVRLHEGGLTLPRKALKRYRALFHQVLAYGPEAVPEEMRDRLTGSLGFLTMVTPACPAMLDPLLERVVAVHGGWLRPARYERREAVQLSYGA